MIVVAEMTRSREESKTDLNTNINYFKYQIKKNKINRETKEDRRKKYITDEVRNIDPNL